MFDLYASIENRQDIPEFDNNFKSATALRPAWVESQMDECPCRRLRLIKIRRKRHLSVYSD